MSDGHALARGGLPVVQGVADLAPIGRGGFAWVYRGWQAEMRRHVAVKVLDGVVDDPHSDRRFRREVAAMGAVSHHPNVVSVYVTGVTDDGHPYLVMPYFPGRTLSERLREAPLQPEAVASIGVKVAGALAAAHETGVLHRDVKPSNILFSAYGEPMLADFGIARLSDSTLTNANVVAATIAYAAPESLSGQEVGAIADVYSLGATLYAALTGEPPYVIGPDETLASFVARAVTQPPGDLRLVGTPDPLATAIERAMAKDPAERTPTATRLQEELVACAQNGTAGPDLAASPAVPQTPAAVMAPPPAAIAATPEPAPEPSPVPPVVWLEEDAAVEQPAAVARSEEAPSRRSGGPISGRRGAWAAAAAIMVAMLLLALVTYRGSQGHQAAAPSSASSPSTPLPSAAPSTTAVALAPEAPTTGRSSIATRPPTPTTTQPPVTTAPVTTAPVTTAPVTTAPVTTAPVTTVPITTAPVTTAPATTVPVTAVPVTTVGISGAPGAATVTETVTKYYALLPGGAASEGFRWLTPAYQAQAGGIDGYRNFWRDIRSVSVSDVTQQGANGATAMLHFLKADGSSSNEHVALGFARNPSTGNFLIDGYLVLPKV